MYDKMLLFNTKVSKPVSTDREFNLNTFKNQNILLNHIN